jgi:hypothetical protein
MSSSFLSLIPTQIQAQSRITYSTDTTLSTDIFSTDVTIDSGVTVTTNGYNFYCTGTFTNDGTIFTGYTGNQGMGASVAIPSGGTAGGSFPNSYGGSGGGGGGSTGGSGFGPAQVSGDGGNTTAVGGASGTNFGGCGFSISEDGGNGSTPGMPSLTTAEITSWYTQGMTNYLAGAGGGGGAGSGSMCSHLPGSIGGSGAYGILIQADDVIAGTIEASGQIGEQPCCGFGTAGSGGGGGGGGGVILLAYGLGGLTAGTYDVDGGFGGYAGPNGGGGGNGGSGQSLYFYFGNSPPITSESTTTSTTPTSSTSSSGAIPEFPVQLGFALLVTVVIAASYVATRRITPPRAGSKSGASGH